MWRYEQATGNLYTDQGELIAKGYSGHGDGLNAPLEAAVPNVGPIPVGVWLMLAPHDSPEHGPFCIPLRAFGATETFGRSGFLIHGDKVDAPGKFLASQGCIILPRSIREQIWASGDHSVQVVAGPSFADIDGEISV